MKIFPVAVCLCLAMLFVQSAEASQIAFTLAHNRYAPSYVPNSVHSYNAGKPITITRSSKGRYEVAFGRVADRGSHVQVSMQDGILASFGYCNVNRWYSGTVWVDCYDEDSAYADRQFTILAIKSCGEDEKLISYAWLNQAGAASYTAHPYWRFGDGTFQVTRTSVGKYSVNLGTPANVGGAVLVNTYKSKDFCNVRGWGRAEAQLECRNKSFSLINSRSTILAIKAGFPHASFIWNSSKLGSIGASWSHSSDGSVQGITRTNKGLYTVKIGPEANPGGNIQVVAYGGSAICYIAGWGKGLTYIRCHNNASLADSQFVVLAIA